MTADAVEVIAAALRGGDIFHSSQQVAAAILAALDANGLAVVPKEATAAMLGAITTVGVVAGCYEDGFNCTNYADDEEAAEMWSAALSAAPTAQPAGKEP